MELAIRDMPEGFGAAEWKDLTNLHPLGLIAVIVLGLVMLNIRRQFSILPLFVMACFVSSVQKLVVFTFDFNLLRIMVIFGLLRLFYRKEYIGFKWIALDKAVLFWTLSSMFFRMLREMTFPAFVNSMGSSFDVLGMYFLFRGLIRDYKDVHSIIFGCIIVSIILMGAFLFENATRKNLFSVFGGVPRITMVREGRLRCQGAFSHPILAGCFWASLMPLFASYWWTKGKKKFWAVAGVFSSGVIVICCASSTPVLGVLAAFFGGGIFFLRNYMKLLRRMVLLFLISLHMIMNAPVWHLIARTSAVGGSTGWHRYNLINQAIERFGEWWLVGTSSTAHWGWGLQDITNQYVLEGVKGGFCTLLLFVTIIVLAFQRVGHLWHSYPKNSYRLAISWALGVSLYVHCVQFIGISYFGQTKIAWYLILAMIGSLPTPPTQKNQIKN